MGHKYLILLFFCTTAPLIAGQSERPKSIVLNLFLSNGTTSETSNEKIYMYGYGQEGAIMQILRSTIRRQLPFIAHSDLLDILTQRNIPPLRGKIKETYTKFIKPELESSLELLRKQYVVKINSTDEWVVAFPDYCFLEHGETLESLGFNTAELKDFWQHFKGAPPTSLSFREWLGWPDMTHLSMENFRRLFDFTKKMERSFYVEGHGTREFGKGMIAEMDPLQYRKFLRILQLLSTRELHIHTCHAEDNIDMHNDCVDEEGAFSLKALSFSITLNSPKKTIVLNKKEVPKQLAPTDSCIWAPRPPLKQDLVTAQKLKDDLEDYAGSFYGKKGFPIAARHQDGKILLRAAFLQRPVVGFGGIAADEPVRYTSVAQGNMHHVFERFYVMRSGLFKNDELSLLELFKQPQSEAPKTFYIKRLQEIHDLRGDEALQRNDCQEQQLGAYNHVAIHVRGKSAECVAKVLFCKGSPEFDSSYVHIVDGKPQKISKEQALAAISGMLKKSEPTADAVLKASDGLQTKEMLQAEICADLELM